jgi:5-methylcytosine-specific restriction endonuclease McrA
MTRAEFPKRVKLDAWTRSGGRCEKCGAKLFPGKFAFDHVKADGLGGTATLDNCQVLCTACHSRKTHEEDRPIMAKADRIRAKWLGLGPAKKKWPARPMRRVEP